MILGHVRDKFPRVLLSVAGREEPIRIEFVADTGFDGALTVPPNVFTTLDATFIGDRNVLLADETPRRRAYYHVSVEWDGEYRTVDAVVMDGRPLLGYEMMEGALLQVEMSDGGEVAIETM